MKSNNRQKELTYSDIKELWECYIDIQTQLLQLRSEDIHIKGAETSIIGNIIKTEIDNSSHEESIKYILNDALGENKYEIQDDFILVDHGIWSQITESEKINIADRLKNHYIDLNTKTNIVVKITPDLGRCNKNMTKSEINTYSNRLASGKFIKGHIDDIVACIARVNINEEAILSRYFGKDHVHSKVNKQGCKTYWIEYENQYIPEPAFTQYSDQIGLYLKGYSIEFSLPDVHIKDILIDRWENVFPVNHSLLVFRRDTKKESKLSVEQTILEINRNITDFLFEASAYCHRDQIKFSVHFVYGVALSRLIQQKKETVNLHITDKKGYSFDGRNIGIDFNWRTENIETICQEIEEAIGDISINRFEDHRFKCRTTYELTGVQPILDELKESFLSIEIDTSSKNGEIIIMLPYTEENYTVLRNELESLLEPLIESNDLTISISNRISDKVQLPFIDKFEDRQVELERRLSDLLRADIGIEVDGRTIIIGKLLKVMYPELIIDINTTDEDKSKAIKEFFSNGTVTSLTPVLVGDVEKLHRLKETYTRAISGHDLNNDNLQNYVFDSSTASPTDGIDTFLMPSGSFMHELEDNLLNTHLNQSQKDAIIKTMVAKDLAIIQGPPGTGKSTAIAELIWQLVRQGRKFGMKREKILLTSETNLAVDNAIARCINAKTNLVKPIRFGDEDRLESEGLCFSLDLMKKWVEQGESALMTISDDDDNETENNKSNSVQPLILKSWLNNIFNRAFYGMATTNDENEIFSAWERVMTNPDPTLRKIVLENYIAGCNVVGATCSSIGDKKANSKYDTSFMKTYNEIFCGEKRGRKSGINFTTVIQDESSKATPAELVLPLVYGEKSVIIGDHKQLPPMLDKEEFENVLEFAIEKAKSTAELDKLKRLKCLVVERFKELEISHFERLYENIDDSLKGTFNLQYRMHPAINEVIEQFYEDCGGLKCGLITPKDLGVESQDVTNFAARGHGINIDGLIAPDTHVLVVDVDTPEMKDGTSRINLGEVEAIDKILSRLESSESYQHYIQQFSKEEDRQIGIISFYGKQIKALRSMARNHSLPVRISTVDRFQGMERNIIIVSMVRSNKIQMSPISRPDYTKFPNSKGYPEQTSLGFAESPNRLNVALSRAKRLLIIVGNRAHFSRHDIYKQMYNVIEHSKYNNRIISSCNL